MLFHQVCVFLLKSYLFDVCLRADKFGQIGYVFVEGFPLYWTEFGDKFRALRRKIIIRFVVYLIYCRAQCF
jgi:hypothetical protein